MSLYVYFGNLRVHAVARLARLAVSDAVGQNDVVLGGVEQLSRPEQLAAERAAHESRRPCHRFRGAPSPRSAPRPARRVRALPSVM